VIKDHLIIFFPLVDWDAPWQRYQHLATTFSKHNKVIYFEPALSIKYLLKTPNQLRKKLAKIFQTKKQIAENLFVLNSPPILPFGNRSHIINCINQFIILLVTKIFIRDFKEKRNLCLWISDAIHYNLIEWLSPKISVYDCTDAFFFLDSKKQAFHDRLRHRTIMKSNISFFTSQLYLDEGKKYSHNCHYVPNGVDTKNFKKRHFPIPKEMRNINRPILGFVGSLDSRIDHHLINEILIKNPDVSLVFVGPMKRNLSKFKNGNRLFLLGKKNYREIPNFINQFDVALIPYRPEKAQAVYPVKLHEYLILGKPVVSTNIREISQFSDVVYIANSKNEFIEKIKLALKDQDINKRKKRIETAVNNTWTDRLRKVNQELEKLI
jgi:glycosyltransferase involved in cell wall biosynthesis